MSILLKLLRINNRTVITVLDLRQLVRRKKNRKIILNFRKIINNKNKITVLIDLRVVKTFLKDLNLLLCLSLFLNQSHQ
jgi:hypothetical protein